MGRHERNLADTDSTNSDDTDDSVVVVVEVTGDPEQKVVFDDFGKYL